jgi:hypothetical protein
VLRGIFGPKRDEIVGGLRILHTWLVGKPEGNRPLGTPKLGGLIILRWVLEREVGVVWTGLVWLRIWTGGKLL